VSHEGALYWSHFGTPKPTVSGFGFPDLKRETVHRDRKTSAPVSLTTDASICAMDRCSVAKSFKDKFQPLRGNFADPDVHWWEVYPAVSRHYGLVVFSHGKRLPG